MLRAVKPVEELGAPRGPENPDRLLFPARRQRRDRTINVPDQPLVRLADIAIAIAVTNFPAQKSISKRHSSAQELQHHSKQYDKYSSDGIPKIPLHQRW